MKSRQLPFVVGVFVLVSLALVIGLTLFFGGSSYFKPKVFAETIVTQSVSGLTVGSPVKFRGVPVGQVRLIEFLGDSPLGGKIFSAPVRIEMELNRAIFNVVSQAEFDAEVSEGVKRGLRAQLSQAGLTGGLVVEMSILEPRDFAEPKLPEGYRPTYGYVPSAPGLLSEFIDRATKVVDGLSSVDFKGISERVDTLLTTGNKLMDERIAPAVTEAQQALAEIKSILADERIDGIIAHVDSVTSSLADAMGGESPANIKSFLAELPKIGAKLREVADHVDAVVANPKIPGIVDALSRDLGPTLGSLRQTIERIDRFVAGEQFDIRQLITGLRSLVANLDALSADLKSDPSRLIFNRPPKPIDPMPIAAPGNH